MTKDRDFKRLTRARMRKTGESYTAARAQLLRKKSTTADAPAPDLAALAGMSDASVKEKTGHTWVEWTARLDRAGAAAWSHRDIAAHLREAHGVPGWWSQMVSVGYERIRGIREVGQRSDGTRAITKSKTVPVPIAVLYRACSEERRRIRWLPEPALVVRKATPQKTILITWPDGTHVDLYFTAKDDGKSVISIEHRRLPSKEAADELKAFWGERLTDLAEMLKR